MKKLLIVLLAFCFVIPAAFAAGDVREVNSNAWVKHLSEMNELRQQIFALTVKADATDADKAELAQLMQTFDVKKEAWDNYLVRVSQGLEKKGECKKTCKKHHHGKKGACKGECKAAKSECKKDACKGECKAAKSECKKDACKGECKAAKSECKKDACKGECKAAKSECKKDACKGECKAAKSECKDACCK